MDKVKIKGFEVISLIGQGALSRIFKAREIATGKIYAIKHIDRLSRQHDKVLNHLRNEYDVAMKLQSNSQCHPSIVRMYDLLTRRSFFMLAAQSLVMDFIEGRDLQRNRNHSVPDLVSIFRQTAEAINYMHRRGMAHADVKPENIMVSRNKKATILDFGFACPIGSVLTSVKGSPECIAPEQLERGMVDQRTDIYNLGAAMYKVISGRAVPSPLAGTKTTGYHIAGDKLKPIPIHELNKEIPREFADLVMTCCRKPRDARPRSMQVVLGSLKAIERDLRPRKNGEN